LRQLADARLFSFGSVTLTLISLAEAVVVIAACLVAARLAGAALRRVRSHARHGGASLYIVEKLVTYGLTIVGAVVALQTLGINLSSLAVFAGAVGVGVGLGLQGIVREFVSGLVLIFDNALHVGDFVEVSKEVRGEVKEIGARATRVRTNDGVDILIPNSKLIDGVITNWTLKGDTRRIHVPFTAGYGCDKDRVREVVLAAACAVPFTLPDQGKRKTQVWMTGLGASAMEFELVVWPSLEAVKRPAAMQAAYTWAIEEALRKAGIEMPFPQMDVRVRSLFGREGDDALRALRLDGAGEGGEAAAENQAESRNDAADDLLAHAGDPSVEDDVGPPASP
jgi:small-conductance mechanosensitive channel